MREMGDQRPNCKKYIAYMKEQRILTQDTSGNYQKGELYHNLNDTSETDWLQTIV